MAAMVRYDIFRCGAGRRALLLAALATVGPARAMDEPAADGPRPLDLNLPRGAGRWSELRAAPLPAVAARPDVAASAAPRARPPWGSGYEARLTPGMAGPAPPGPGHAQGRGRR